MNALMWMLQVLLAMHTETGAVWKLSHGEQTVPSLQALPHGVWVVLSGLELLAGVGLILPLFGKRFGILAPVAASFVVAEMLLFSAVHLASGNPEHGELVYWLVVTAIAAFVAIGRLRLQPATH